MLGAFFEAELREQPELWRRIAASSKAAALARAIGERDVVLVGSGSSLYVGQLGALALRRRGIRASALAATEAVFDHTAYQGCAVIALSQSGRSSDVLGALDVLRPASVVALTNDVHSPLAARSTCCIALDAGVEQAVPASKTVTAMAAILLWAAALIAGKSTRSAITLAQTAEAVEHWLQSVELDAVVQAAKRLTLRRSVVIVGAGYGVPVAHEVALKIKEASYVHAEGFAAGEFRHGSEAMLDASCAILGIVDDASRSIIRRPLAEAAVTESLRYVIGSEMDDVPLLGPVVGEAFNTLAWLVTGQTLALHLGRIRGVQSDAPRGLRKFIEERTEPVSVRTRRDA
ncbi:MAG: SIS domain-containing protein [Candidatus Eremiobacteraeota bacterium]|nr:SIS domain-containing protein [Candidatus Eremiobacteraeota bacterium]